MHRITAVGGGFAGLTTTIAAALAIAEAGARVTPHGRTGAAGPGQARAGKAVLEP
ncbi:hypothetical protein GCM10010389_38770 [Streptomyces echinoruber]|uniref:Uncharacterized protein n=1 Tax=Streptomyces echinoruber TaxID=68898 RepID=A0A918VGD5_9ACTN|nr:hypothetical protein GCM10010389_38770 [Streptomyces echinoruber]